MHKATKHYDLILAIFVGLLLISNIGAVKLIELGPIITNGGAILFPLTYIFGDVLTEVYGYKYARRAIWTAFGVMALASITFLIVGSLPPANAWENQESWDAILGFVPRIVIASLVAFLFGQFINSYVLAKLKIKTKGKKLWLRLMGSTIVGQLIDTTIFGLIAFGGILSGNEMLGFIAFGWAFKVSVEFIFMPVTYQVIKYLKKDEKLDTYDKKSNFTPFKLDV